MGDLITAWGTGPTKEGKKTQYYVLPRKFYSKYKDSPLIANAAMMHLFYETLETIPTVAAELELSIKTSFILIESTAIFSFAPTILLSNLIFNFS